MRAALIASAAIACAAASHRGGRAVYIEAVTEAAAVEAQLEKELELEGDRIVRGPEGADLTMRLEWQGTLEKSIDLRAPGAYTLTVVRGRAPGKKFTSLDQVCRTAGQLPSECHAGRFLRDLEESGELK